MASSKGPSFVICSGDVLPRIHTGQSLHFQDAHLESEQGARPEAKRKELDQLAKLVQQCGNARSLSQGKWVYSRITKHGYDGDKWVGNLLVQMYGKCGSLEDARMVFEKIHPKNVFSWTIMISAYAQNGHMQEARSTFDNMPPHRDLVSWNAMITGYAHNRHPVDALVLFRRLNQEGIQPNRVTFLSVLEACGSRASLTDGRAIHADIVTSGFGADIAIGTALVSMYGKCASIQNAKNTFDRMPEKNVVAWTAMLAAHAQNGHLQEARHILLQMPGRNVVSWHVMISAYAQNGHPKEALGLFTQMDLQGTMPDKHTCISILDACCSNLEDGKKIHSSIAGSSLEYDVALQTALVDMYGKCGSVQEAKNVFLKMPVRNVVSWTAMLAANARNGHLGEALTLFREMDLEGEQPNQVTLITILGACSPREGNIIVAEIVDMGFLDAATGAAIISMYGKWGLTRAARSTFRSLPRRDVVAWNAMLAACTHNEALELFRMMILEGMHPDGITFVSALSACVHGGLLQNAWTCFLSIDSDHGIVRTVEHYRCMIDLLARAGQLKEAEDLMRSMPFEADGVAWKSLLGACRLQADEWRGTRVAQSALENDQCSAAPYVLLSNIYQAHA